jgi:hypothetical protein
VNRITHACVMTKDSGKIADHFDVLCLGTKEHLVAEMAMVSYYKEDGWRRG